MLLLDILFATLVLFPLPADEIWWAFTRGTPAASFEPSALRIPLALAGLVAFAVRERAHLLANAGAKLAWAAAALAALLLLGALIAYDRGVGAEAAVSQLTYGAGAIPLLALAALLVRRWSDEPWSASLFVRLGARLAAAWRGALERAPARALWGAAAAVGSLLFWLALVRHRAFESHAYDIGIFTNAIWNLTHGYGYVSSIKGGINLFADHQSPLFWALAPLFRLAPWPETLLLVQAFGLAAGGPALFYLARARFGAAHWAGAALPWLYWCYLPLRKANAFDFHPEVFMLPLFLWAFAAFTAQRPWVKALGVLALAAALGSKETAAVVATGIGIAWALTSAAESWRKAWPGLALALAGIAVFVFDLKVVPRFFGDDYAYLGLYDQFGGGVANVLLAPFTQPAMFFSHLVSYERLHFLFWTLAPLGFLPLFAWRAALAALPAYLMLFLTDGDQRVRIVFHYGIEPGTALFWALPFGLAAFAARFGWRSAGLWMLFWALACLQPREAGWARLHEMTDHKQWLHAQALPCLDPQAPLAATGSLAAHLATRRWISLPEARQQQPGGAPVGCVVTDARLDNWPLKPLDFEYLVAGLPAEGYREAYRCRSFSVHRLEGAACLRCTPQCSAP